MSNDSFFPVAPPIQSAFLRPVVAASTIACLLAALATGWTLNRQSEASAGARARTLAALVATGLQADSLQAAIASTPEAGAVRDWSAAPPAVSDGHTALVRAVNALAGPAELTLLHLRDDRRDRVRNAPEQVHSAAMYETLASARVPAWKEVRAYKPAMAPALIDGVATHSGRTAGPRGDHTTGYAPVFNERGAVVAVVQATLPLDASTGPWRSGGLVLWLGLLSVALLGPASLVWAGQSASRRLRMVGSDVRALSRGTELGSVPDAPFAELDAMMDGFEDLFRTLKHTRTSHARERARLEAELSAATEPVEAPETERRDQIQLLAGELQVSMRVADESRSTRLVDYWRDSITVAFRSERAYDLAPGMAVVLTIGTDDGPPAAIPCVFVQNLATEAGIEIQLRATTLVSPSTLPLPLARHIEQRREPRHRPPSSARIRVAIFPLRVGRPMSASLVDVSRQGMCVVLPVSHAAVSTWGTSIAIGLKMRPHHPPLRLSATIRAARPHAGGKTILGIELDSVTHAADRGHLHAYHHWLSQAVA